MKRLALVLGTAFLLAGCSWAGIVAPPAMHGSPAHATSKGACRMKSEVRAVVKLHRDLAAIKAAGRIHVRNRLIGGAELNHATDRFLHDLAKAPISNLMRNRLIDFAAEAAFANCQQCFQALEAERPIPSIAHDGTGSSC